MPKPPAIILLEEIEDGISQRNIRRLIESLYLAARTIESDSRGHHTQFVLTSHSPAVVREFWQDLDAVYYVRLDRGSYRTVMANLNDTFAAFVDMGSVEPVEDI